LRNALKNLQEKTFASKNTKLGQKNCYKKFSIKKRKQKEKIENKKLG